MGMVMGVLNVTPDSFSDGGLFVDRAAAVGHGRRMLSEGAAIIDVGGESTRPGAVPTEEEEEVARVVSVIEELAAEPAVASGQARISIDTRRSTVARAAVAAGATIINDVGAGLAGVAAELGVGWVAMHMRGIPQTMQDQPAYDDVVAEVHHFLVERAKQATTAGVPEVWIDPGIGFGKTTTHNLLLMRNLDRLVCTGFSVLVGVSRKRFLGEITARSDSSATHRAIDEEPAKVDDRREASVALATWSYQQGVAVVRAHDVRATVRAARLAVGR
tara:strand:+ start:764 stop:1585 length:822 start_codon:yes stop_codon:yes gene_type:complete